VIGTGAAIRMPSFTAQLDYEAELGVVIGRRTRDIRAADAQSAVAGYVILNDLSARDMMKRKDARTSHLMDWFGMKSFEDSAPMGRGSLRPSSFGTRPPSRSSFGSTARSNRTAAPARWFIRSPIKSQR